jgi:hypothetical protein
MEHGNAAEEGHPEPTNSQQVTDNSSTQALKEAQTGRKKRGTVTKLERKVGVT